MSADRAEELVPGVWHWRVRDERIGGAWGCSHAADGILIDPHPLADDTLEQLDRISAIVLTTGSHQRAAWSLRRELGVPVYVPALAQQVDEEPDERYTEGDALPGGLGAIFTPGAGTTQHTLLLRRDAGVLFTPDLFVRVPQGPLDWVPFEYMHDPEEAKRSAARLLDVEFDVLCMGHGAPLVGGAKEALAGLVQGS
ncbi:MAG: MBL fold metallo-hydrolase [Thermoleophilia bacterium]|nr:MBL fold metallo-hydrolase [Thermoleophilia bacterium]